MSLGGSTDRIPGGKNLGPGLERHDLPGYHFQGVFKNLYGVGFFSTWEKVTGTFCAKHPKGHWR